jgi:hypothetical protein
MKTRVISFISAIIAAVVMQQHNVLAQTAPPLTCEGGTIKVVVACQLSTPNGWVTSPQYHTCFEAPPFLMSSLIHRYNDFCSYVHPGWVPSWPLYFPDGMYIDSNGFYWHADGTPFFSPAPPIQARVVQDGVVVAPF